jgi:hypothetical protein
VNIQRLQVLRRVDAPPVPRLIDARRFKPGRKQLNKEYGRQICGTGNQKDGHGIALTHLRTMPTA